MPDVKDADIFCFPTDKASSEADLQDSSSDSEDELMGQYQEAVSRSQGLRGGGARAACLPKPLGGFTWESRQKYSPLTADYGGYSSEASADDGRSSADQGVKDKRCSLSPPWAWDNKQRFFFTYKHKHSALTEALSAGAEVIKAELPLSTLSVGGLHTVNCLHNLHICSNAFYFFFHPKMSVSRPHCSHEALILFRSSVTAEVWRSALVIHLTSGRNTWTVLRGTEEINIITLCSGSSKWADLYNFYL